jgi:predicted O-methyltransferase YrrM
MSTKLEWKPQPMPDGQTIDSSVTPAEIAALQDLAAGRRVLEVGSAYGYSTIRLAERAAHVDAVDPHAGELPGSYETMLANLERYGAWDKVTILRDYSEHALPALIEAGHRYGLAFVDGNHDYNVQRDVENALTLLVPGGHVAVHDYDQYDFPVITQVCDAVNVQHRVVDTLWIACVDDLP